MGFRPVSQRLRDINLQALGKFSCLALVLGLESVSHPAGPVQAPSFSQGTASPSFATPLGLDGPARARAEML
uniref:mucoid induction factor MucE n=1 Tax=Pseudomonas aeruginosa TaxID=287 RepID=UPI00106CF77E